MKILFLNHAPTIEHMDDMSELFEMSYISPIATSGPIDHKVMWLGPWIEEEKSVDWEVFKTCLEYQPDVIFIYGWRFTYNDKEKYGYTSLAALYLLRNMLGTKIVALLFDQSPGDFKRSDSLTRLCDFIFTHEHHSLIKHSSFPKKHIITTATFSPDLFHCPPAIHRRVEIGFAGGIQGYKNTREKGLYALHKAGIWPEVPGGRSPGQQRLTNQEYADFFQSCKIVLNWSRHISGKWFQAKARIFEATLSGAMLLSEECPAVNHWLEPWIDYVPFSNNEQLVQRAKYYMSNDSERLSIATQGHKTAMEKYSAKPMWQSMIWHLHNTTHYNNNEALYSLWQNSSQNELRAASIIQKNLYNFSSLPFDVDSQVAAVQETLTNGYKSVRRKTIHKINYGIHSSRRLRSFHWIVLRKMLPKAITRKSVSHFLRSDKYKTVK